MTDTEIVQLLKNRFGNAKRGNGDWVRIWCPTCDINDKAKMKRGVNLKTLTTHCFICERPMSLQQLFGEEHIPAGRIVMTEKEEHPQARTWPCTSYTPVNALPKDHPAVKFLERDHILDLDRVWEDYSVGYISPEDAIPIHFKRHDGTAFDMPLGDSLLFPVFYKEELVGWQARYVGSKVKKLKYMHVFPKGEYLYNYDNACVFTNVVVVEGVKKAWKFPNAVATLGKGITAKQIQLLDHWEEITLMYDGEDRTQSKARELVEQIQCTGKKCINIDPRKFGFDSPDEMTEIEAQEIVYKSWNSQAQKKQS
jgi:hypothetical protein